MRWPWSPKLPRPQPTSDDVADAVASRRRAEKALASDRERSGEVHSVAAASRRNGAVNHFAELIIETFRG